jgi:hypothetical protein
MIGAMKTYAEKNGMTINALWAEFKLDESFPKGKPGRPRNEVAPDTPEMERKHKRPKGAPPKHYPWDEELGVYINSEGEVYQKVDKVSSGRPKGRPPRGKVWSEVQGEYVDKV